MGPFAFLHMLSCLCLLLCVSHLQLVLLIASSISRIFLLQGGRSLFFLAGFLHVEFTNLQTMQHHSFLQMIDFTGGCIRCLSIS